MAAERKSVSCLAGASRSLILSLLLWALPPDAAAQGGAQDASEAKPSPSVAPEKLAREASLDFVEVPTGVEAQPTLKMFLRLPEGLPEDMEKLDLAERLARKEEKRKPPEGVLVYLTWKKDPESLVEAATAERGDIPAWAADRRFAVVVFDVHKHWQTHWSYDRLDRQALRQQDADFDLLTKAFRRGMDEFTKRHDLPEDGYLLYGISGGAHWGHRLVMRLPERFLGAHIHVANSYDEPDRRADDVVWLVTTGDMDDGADAARRFYDHCYELNFPILFKMGRALGHSDRSDIRELGLRFFDHLLALKERYGAGDTPRVFRSELEAAPWIGDAANQTVYPASAATKVPERQRIPLPPNRELVGSWGTVRQ